MFELSTVGPQKQSVLFYKLSGKTVRSALNMYTSKLRYGQSYVLTAAPALRKELIRNDALPDVKAVVTADLDLRDLYRNAMHTAVDDVAAELALLDRADPDEVRTLLETATSAADAWFALIDEADVRAAELALRELETRLLQVDE